MTAENGVKWSGTFQVYQEGEKNMRLSEPICVEIRLREKSKAGGENFNWRPGSPKSPVQLCRLPQSALKMLDENGKKKNKLKPYITNSQILDVIANGSASSFNELLLEPMKSNWESFYLTLLHKDLFHVPLVLLPSKDDDGVIFLHGFCVDEIGESLTELTSSHLFAKFYRLLEENIMKQKQDNIKIHNPFESLTDILNTQICPLRGQTLPSIENNCKGTINSPVSSNEHSEIQNDEEKISGNSRLEKLHVSQEFDQINKLSTSSDNNGTFESEQLVTDKVIGNPVLGNKTDHDIIKEGCFESTQGRQEDCQIEENNVEELCKDSSTKEIDNLLNISPRKGNQGSEQPNLESKKCTTPKIIIPQDAFEESDLHKKQIDEFHQEIRDVHMHHSDDPQPMVQTLEPLNFESELESSMSKGEGISEDQELKNTSSKDPLPSVTNSIKDSDEPSASVQILKDLSEMITVETAANDESPYKNRSHLDFPPQSVVIIDEVEDTGQEYSGIGGTSTEEHGNNEDNSHLDFPPSSVAIIREVQNDAFRLDMPPPSVQIISESYKKSDFIISEDTTNEISVTRSQHEYISYLDIPPPSVAIIGEVQAFASEAAFQSNFSPLSSTSTWNHTKDLLPSVPPTNMVEKSPSFLENYQFSATLLDEQNMEKQTISPKIKLRTDLYKNLAKESVKESILNSTRDDLSSPNNQIFPNVQHSMSNKINNSNQNQVMIEENTIIQQQRKLIRVPQNQLPNQLLQSNHNPRQLYQQKQLGTNNIQANWRPGFSFQQTNYRVRNPTFIPRNSIMAPLIQRVDDRGGVSLTQQMQNQYSVNENTYSARPQVQNNKIIHTSQGMTNNQSMIANGLSQCPTQHIQQQIDHTIPQHFPRTQITSMMQPGHLQPPRQFINTRRQAESFHKPLDPSAASSIQVNCGLENTPMLNSSNSSHIQNEVENVPIPESMTAPNQCGTNKFYLANNSLNETITTQQAQNIGPTPIQDDKTIFKMWCINTRRNKLVSQVTKEEIFDIIFGSFEWDEFVRIYETQENKPCPYSKSLTFQCIKEFRESAIRHLTGSDTDSGDAQLLRSLLALPVNDETLFASLYAWINKVWSTNSYSAQSKQLLKTIIQSSEVDNCECLWTELYMKIEGKSCPYPFAKVYQMLELYKKILQFRINERSKSKEFLFSDKSILLNIEGNFIELFDNSVAMECFKAFKYFFSSILDGRLLEMYRSLTLSLFNTELGVNKYVENTRFIFMRGFEMLEKTKAKEILHKEFPHLRQAVYYDGTILRNIHDIFSTVTVSQVQLNSEVDLDRVNVFKLLLSRMFCLFKTDFIQLFKKTMSVSELINKFRDSSHNLGVNIDELEEAFYHFRTAVRKKIISTSEVLIEVDKKSLEHQPAGTEKVRTEERIDLPEHSFRSEEEENSHLHKPKPHDIRQSFQSLLEKEETREAQETTRDPHNVNKEPIDGEQLSGDPERVEIASESIQDEINGKNSGLYEICITDITESVEQNISEQQLLQDIETIEQQEPNLDSLFEKVSEPNVYDHKSAEDIKHLLIKKFQNTKQKQIFIDFFNGKIDLNTFLLNANIIMKKDKLSMGKSYFEEKWPHFLTAVKDGRISLRDLHWFFEDTVLNANYQLEVIPQKPEGTQKGIENCLGIIITSVSSIVEHPAFEKESVANEEQIELRYQTQSEWLMQVNGKQKSYRAIFTNEHVIFCPLSIRLYDKMEQDTVIKCKLFPDKTRGKLYLLDENKSGLLLNSFNINDLDMVKFDKYFLNIFDHPNTAVVFRIEVFEELFLKYEAKRNCIFDVSSKVLNPLEEHTSSENISSTVVRNIIGVDEENIEYRKYCEGTFDSNAKYASVLFNNSCLFLPLTDLFSPESESTVCNQTKDFWLNCPYGQTIKVKQCKIAGKGILKVFGNQVIHAEMITDASKSEILGLVSMGKPFVIKKEHFLQKMLNKFFTFTFQQSKTSKIFCNILCLAQIEVKSKTIPDEQIYLVYLQNFRAEEKFPENEDQVDPLPEVIVCNSKHFGQLQNADLSLGCHMERVQGQSSEILFRIILQEKSRKCLSNTPVIRFVDKKSSVTYAIVHGDLVLTNKCMIDNTFLINWECIFGGKHMEELHKLQYNESLKKSSHVEDENTLNILEKSHEISVDQNVEEPLNTRTNLCSEMATFSDISHMFEPPTIDEEDGDYNIDLYNSTKDELIDIPGVDNSKAIEIIDSREKSKTFLEFIQNYGVGFKLLTEDVQYDVGLLGRHKINLLFNGKKLDISCLQDLECLYMKKHLKDWKRPNIQTEVMLAVMAMFVNNKIRDDFCNMFRTAKSSAWTKYAKQVDSFMRSKLLIDKIEKADKKAKMTPKLKTRIIPAKQIHSVKKKYVHQQKQRQKQNIRGCVGSNTKTANQPKQPKGHGSSMISLGKPNVKRAAGVGLKKNSLNKRPLNLLKQNPKKVQNHQTHTGAPSDELVLNEKLFQLGVDETVMDEVEGCSEASAIDNIVQNKSSLQISSSKIVDPIKTLSEKESNKHFVKDKNNLVDVSETPLTSQKQGITPLTKITPKPGEITLEPVDQSDFDSDSFSENEDTIDVDVSDNKCATLPSSVNTHNVSEDSFDIQSDASHLSEISDVPFQPKEGSAIPAENSELSKNEKCQIVLPSLITKQTSSDVENKHTTTEKPCSSSPSQSNGSVDLSHHLIRDIWQSRLSKSVSEVSKKSLTRKTKKPKTWSEKINSDVRKAGEKDAYVPHSQLSHLNEMDSELHPNNQSTVMSTTKSEKTHIHLTLGIDSDESDIVAPCKVERKKKKSKQNICAPTSEKSPVEIQKRIAKRPCNDSDTSADDSSIHSQRVRKKPKSMFNTESSDVHSSQQPTHHPGKCVVTNLMRNVEKVFLPTCVVLKRLHPDKIKRLSKEDFSFSTSSKRTGKLTLEEALDNFDDHAVFIQGYEKLNLKKKSQLLKMKKTFQCNICKEVFYSFQERHIHIIEKHVEDDPSMTKSPAVFLCKVRGAKCSAVFTDPSRRHEHYLVNHVAHDKVATVGPFTDYFSVETTGGIKADDLE